MAPRNSKRMTFDAILWRQQFTKGGGIARAMEVATIVQIL